MSLLGAASPLHAVMRQTVEHASVAGSYSFQFLRYLPPHYGEDPAIKWPLMIMLHGAGEIGTNPEVLALNGPPMLIEQGHDFPAVVISPQAVSHLWDLPALAAFIDDLIAHYQIDPARIYLTGLSFGGYGTWALAGAYPDRFAAVVPICGGGETTQAAKLRDVPVWAFHGDSDPIVPLSDSQRMIDAIRAAGGDPRFTIYPGVGHASWVPAYNTEDLYTWMFAQSLVTVPQIVVQPQACTMAAGDTAVLRVEAAGRKLAYQWKKDGRPISDATSPWLILRNVQAVDGGTYSVTVTNLAGSVTSQPAELTCWSTADRGRLINVSVRTTTGAGDQLLIVGFVTGGAGASGSNRYLVHGLGPRLADFSVPNALSDPDVGIFAAGISAPIASNDDWAGDARVGTTAAELGATPLTDPKSKDAALLVELFRGAYSIRVTGKNSTTGTTLTSVYDAGPDDLSAAKPQLINISARAQTTNANPLIAGFVITGSTARTVLIRGLGPYLSPLLGAGATPNPKIEVRRHEGATNRVIIGNDNWGGEAQLASIAQIVGAQPLAATSKDAALITTLSPGVYSVVVTDVDSGKGGIALVEVYAVP